MTSFQKKLLSVLLIFPILLIAVKTFAPSSSEVKVGDINLQVNYHEDTDDLIKKIDPESCLIEIRNELLNATSVDDVKNKLKRIWISNKSTIDIESLPSCSDEDVASGILLPEEYPKAGQLEILAQNNKNVMLMLNAALIASHTCPELIYELALDRSNTLPPNSIDIIIFLVLDAAVGEWSPSKTYVEFDKWESLSAAKNPFYRVLALRASSGSTSRSAKDVNSESITFNKVDGQYKLKFYLDFLEEDDEVILFEVIRRIALVPTEEARLALLKFAGQRAVSDNARLLPLVKDAIVMQSRIRD
jgi:hypothetical protein